jgi:hypothetical protein
MQKIADMFDVSQSTISTSVKEIAFRKEIYGLQQELSEARARLKEIGYDDNIKLLPPDTQE